MDLDLSSFVSSNGYALLVLGLVLEGETAVVLASVAAHRGWLQLGAVGAIASAPPGATKCVRACDSPH